MSNTRIVLRKCSEHESCQLQQKDFGPWEHTSAKLTLSERLTGWAKWQQAAFDEIGLHSHKSKNRLQSATESEARFRQVESAVDHTLARLQAIELDLEHTRKQGTEALRKAQESERHAAEKLALTEDKLSTFDRVEHALVNLESLQKELLTLSTDIRADMAAITGRLNETQRQIRHERDERLAATSKEQRQIHALADKISARSQR